MEMQAVKSLVELLGAHARGVTGQSGYSFLHDAADSVSFLS